MVDVYTIDEAGQKLGCKRSRIFELLRDGTLERAPRYGREIRIYAASVDRALAPRVAQRRRARRERPPTVDLANIDPKLLS